MRVTVDAIACEANARCASLAPELFSIHEDADGEDVLEVAADGEVPPALEEAVREAVRVCPKMALTVTD